MLAVGVSGAVSEWLIPGGVDSALLGLALTYAFQVHTGCSPFVGLCCIDGHQCYITLTIQGHGLPEWIHDGGSIDRNELGGHGKTSRVRGSHPGSFAFPTQ